MTVRVFIIHTENKPSYCLVPQQFHTLTLKLKVTLMWLNDNTSPYYFSSLLKATQQTRKKLCIFFDYFYTLRGSFLIALFDVCG